MSWSAASIHVLDFEGSRHSGIVEFGVATLTNGKVIAARSRLCAPASPVPAAETAVHGIADADITDAAPFTLEHDFFAQLRLTGPLAAHHAPVERGLLRRIWPLPPASPDFAAVNPGAAPRLSDWGPWLDTRRIYERLYPGLPNYQLMDLVQTFALNDQLSNLASLHCPANRRRPHCALYDALAAALLLARLTTEPTIAAAPLSWLFEQSVTPDERDAFRQGGLALDN